jgi:hypothetical protein
MALMGPTHDHGEIRAWASRHEVLPTELLPHHVNGEPVLLQLTLASAMTGRLDLRVISWEDFFARFDLLGLTVVYDDDGHGYNELLQRPENDDAGDRFRAGTNVH